MSEVKRYVEARKPTLAGAFAIGKGLVKEFLAVQNNNQRDLVDEPVTLAPKKEQAKLSPEELVKDHFYAPYLDARGKIVQRLSSEGFDITTHPVQAAFVSLMAASQATGAFSMTNLYKDYSSQFRLPEQYLFAEQGGRVRLLPDTRNLASEIVQAWILADYYSGEHNPISEVYDIPHRSLRKTTCSFQSTCRGTDLTFEDLGVKMHAPPSDLIGDNFTELRPGLRMEGANQEMIEEIGENFMAKVSNW